MYADLLSCNMDCGIKYVWTVGGSLHYSFMCRIGCHLFRQTLREHHIYKHNPNRYDILFWTYQLCGLEWMPCCLSIPMQNHLAERHWVEVNTCVNYPVKTALAWMQQNMVIDLDCPVTKYVCLWWLENYVKLEYSCMFVHGKATGFLVTVNMSFKSMLTLTLIWLSFRSSPRHP